MHRLKRGNVGRKKRRDKGVTIKEEERQHAGCSKSLSGSGERRGPCPDLWPPAGVIRE